MPRFKNISGINVQLTAEEETARDAEEAQAVIDMQAEADAKVVKDAADAQKATDKANAKVKLKAAEYTPLTEAEADAITG